MDFLQTLEQKQTISQNMIESCEILQMNAEELAAYLKEVSLENPVMELDEKGSDRLEERTEDRIKKLEWLESLDEQNHAYYQYDAEEQGTSSDQQTASVRGRESIEEILLWQLLPNSYSEQEMRTFRFIIGNLDSNGFYTETVGETAGELGVSCQLVQNCLEILKGLEPCGICCSGLTECLLKQLEKRESAGQTADYGVEKQIVKHYLKELAENRILLLTKQLKTSAERIGQAKKTICSLNPRPLQGFSDQEETHYIVPDITIIKFRERFEILINSYTYPSLHISRQYLGMLKGDCPQDTRVYLLNKLNQAQRIKDNILRRNETLLRVGTVILEQQMDFFLYGEKAIKSLRMKDVAAKLAVHESTVSRAIKEKYLQCCWGTYPLSYFFPGGIEGPQGNGTIAMATVTVKEKIRELIMQEDRRNPYSDQRIAELLREQGIVLSRRTVEKYRESMQISNSRTRKEF